LQKALATSKDVHFLFLIFRRISSAFDSMISSSVVVKCPEVLGTVVRFRGRLVSDASGSRYSLGIAASRRLRAIRRFLCNVVPSLQVSPQAEFQGGPSGEIQRGQVELVKS
jgi:hypothetical protein